jgi:hypothetical protein
LNVEQGFKNATGMFREMAVPFWMAVTMRARRMAGRPGRAPDARPLLDEARAVFEGLGAAPWLERLDRSRRRSASRPARDRTQRVERGHPVFA